MCIILAIIFVARCAKYGLWKENQSCDILMTVVADIIP